jgi:hypothetical protein
MRYIFDDLLFKIILCSLVIKNFYSKGTNLVDSIEFVSPNANNSTFMKEFLSVPINHSEWLKIRDGMRA